MNPQDHLTEHFQLKEFLCHCGKCEPSEEVIEQLKIRANELEILRSVLNEPIIVESGYRCPPHNDDVKGAPNSRHMKGDASDVRCKNKKPKEIYDVTQMLVNEGRLKPGGLHLYETFVHIDHRGVNKRWK